MSDDLDETIEETFPASDAPGNTPETGIRIDPASDAAPPEPLTEEERPRQETVRKQQSQRDGSRVKLPAPD